ncbi:MAG: hypothetical protein AAFZ63_11715 [Bacteroidota bacterium]
MRRTKNMGLRVKRWTLLFCASIVVNAALAQLEFAVADEIQEIRQRYYSLQEHLDDLQVYDFEKGGKAYLQNGEIVKLSMTSWQRAIDYYFTAQGDLYFIFERAGEQENRYYFTIQIGNPIDVDLPTLIRWQDPAGQIVDRGQEEAELLALGLEKASEAAQFFATAKLYQTFPGVECRLLAQNRSQVEQEVATIRRQVQKECERIDRASVEDKVELNCVDQTSRYCTPGTETTRWEFTEEGCDPGCALTTFTEKYVFYDQEGTVCYREDASLTNLYGMAEYSPYEQQSEQYFSKTVSYYVGGELFYQEKQYGLNDKVLYIGVEPTINWNVLE